jgi:hypothetical protein
VRVRVGWWATIAVAGAVVAFGCGDDGASEPTAAADRGTQNSSTTRVSSPSSVAEVTDTPSTSGSSSVTSLADDDWRPPALVVESRSGRIEVGAFYYGTSTMAADGTTPPSGPPVAKGSAVQVAYPAPGWTFTAVARKQHGGRGVKLRITTIDEHRFEINAPAPGSYEILVDGQSPIGERRGAGYVFTWVVLPS